MKDLVIRGAKEHNLRDIDLVLPRGRLIVITGPSGSGKSSLAIDTIHAEAEWRLLDTLSMQARTVLERCPKPRVDSIEGLSPTICVRSHKGSVSPRSTVGTITEIYDFLRLLYAKIGEARCPNCGTPIRGYTVQEMVDAVLSLRPERRFSIVAPIVRNRGGGLAEELERCRREGFIRAYIDGQLVEIAEPVKVDPRREHTLELQIDRLSVRSEVRQRLAESVELALSKGDRVAIVRTEDGEDLFFSELPVCSRCDFRMPPITPGLFSFNTPEGACSKCGGLGAIPRAAPREDEEPMYAADEPCGNCGGSRLSVPALSVTIAGKNIDEVSRMAVPRVLDFLANLGLEAQQTTIATDIIRGAERKLRFLCQVGLSYLALGRSIATLSGGETERLRLAHQLGSGLIGVLYIFDEPTIGLHPKDAELLMKALSLLRDQGSTVLLVEHDPQAISAADHVVEMGPGAGEHGGRVVAAGTVAEIMEVPGSVSGAYLSGRRKVSSSQGRRKGKGALTLAQVTTHNLRAIDAVFPLHTLTCVTGVSGSGKSSLVMETLLPAVRAFLGKKKAPHFSTDAVKSIERVIAVDQMPLGSSPRSSPASYTGLLAELRRLFATLPEARVRGYGPGRFSFNVKGGRCEACEGEGVVRVDMHFLPDVYARCDVCRGERYNRETLEVRYRGLGISDVLQSSVDEGARLFANIPRIREISFALQKVGLGYLRLGQPANTLSGGEAQRVKLARELARRSSGHTLYVFDEPTIGLHFGDVEVLVGLLHDLVDVGHTVIVIEHNLDVIKNADHVIDLGPDAGDQGGQIVATGTPEQIAEASASHTGRYLRPVLSRA